MSLLTEIQSACTPEEIGEGNFHAIAAKVNAARAGTKVPVSRLTSERGLLELYADGPIAADAVLAKLEAYAGAGQLMSRLVGRALKFLADPAGLDLGAVATRAMLDQLAAGGVLTSDEATKLKSIAEKDKPLVTWNECAAALGA